jgi:hypothetical protein
MGGGRRERRPCERAQCALRDGGNVRATNGAGESHGAAKFRFASSGFASVV